MVKRLYSKKTFWLAITIFVIANLSLGGTISAKQLEIKARDVEKIKTVLSMAQTLTNISDLILHNKDLLTVLNTVIKGGNAGTDVTYGLVVLSALNEMDLVDLVVSQRYKTEAREYFSQVLKERTDLTSYWKGIGYDLPRILSGYITGPMAALTLNTFAITDKTIAIFVEFNVLEKMKLYDGLWYYFDTRKQGNEPHEVAWEETKEVLGWTARPSFSFRTINKFENEKETQLEQQFLTLYDKWEPYVTPFGISDEYKKQTKEELSIVLIAAAKENAALVKNELKPSLIDKLAQQLEKLKEATAVLIAKINPFKAGIVLNLPEESELKGVGLPLIEELAENSSPLTEEISAPEELSENSSRTIELLATTTELIIPESTTTPESSATTTEPMPIPEPPPTPTPQPEPISGPVFCERSSDNPARFRVLINEIAWMGTVNSPNDEWIELKNVWGIPVKLSGWQLLDKDKQIKIVFNESDIIPAGGYYLLERTDDNSMPDAEADLIYTGALSNTDEALYLFDDQCNIEDEVLANSNWLAGDNSQKKPMERFDILYWYTGQGSPKSENTSPPATFSSASAAPSPTPVSTSLPSYPKILITEVQISPLTERFVELYNPNSETVNLTGWYIQRKVRDGSPSSFVSSPNLEGKTIGPLDYFLVAHSSSTVASSADILLNLTLTPNNTLLLKNPEREIVDEVSWQNIPEGFSYGRVWDESTNDYSENWETQTPTPTTQNQGSLPPPPSQPSLLTVAINEIAWMGTNANPADEWIELYVNSTTTLDGWRILGIKNGTTTLEIPLSSFASSSSYILIERSDDNTISDIPTDFFFTGDLYNKGMRLELQDSNGELIDEVECQNGWFAGESSPNYISMERINPLAGSDPANWASNNLITKNGLDADGNLTNGTPKAKNSVTKSFTEITGGLNISEDLTLTLLGSPYIVEGSIAVGIGAKLTIEPGVTIKFKHHAAWHSELKVEGELEAIGGDAVDQKIVFTSFYDATGTTPAAGDWEWLYFKDAQASLKNVIVKYAGKEAGYPLENTPFTRGAIQIDEGQVTIENLLVEESQTLGLWIKNSTNSLITTSEFKGINTFWSKPAAVYIENGSSTISNSTFENNNIGILIENFASTTIENNTFEGNQIPIQISTLLPKISGNTFDDNNYNGIYLTDLAFPEGQTSITWSKTNIPYVANNLTLNSGLTLRVEPGVVIKFLNNSRLNINGNFEANGTTSDKIVFTSIQDDEYGGDTNNDGTTTQPVAGRWHYIYFSSSSASPILENVIVRYGGWYNVSAGGSSAKSGAVKTENASLTVKNSLFENNHFAGLEIANATTTIENTAFNKNEYGIYVESGECPSLTGVSFGEGENANTTDVFPVKCHP